MDQEPPADVYNGLSTARIRQLHQQAASWVQTALTASQLLPPTVYGAAAKTPSDISPVDATVIAASFFHHLDREGVVVLELFGGLCAGLDMLLRNGVRVLRYIYCDISPVCSRVASHRMQQLAAAYPRQFNMRAYKDALVTLPADVFNITHDALLDADALDGNQWLVVAGWDCSNMSPAGDMTGVEGTRSNTFYPTVHIIKQLQAIQVHRPPGYICENTATQFNWKSEFIRMDTTSTVCQALGEPVAIDAAQLGAYAHRMRNYWSNLAAPSEVQSVVAVITRDPRQIVNDILDPGRTTQDVTSFDQPPHFRVNVPGQPMRALPTLVAYIGSHAYREGKPGMIIGRDGHLTVPNIQERETILGYPRNCTAAPGITDAQRHGITGRCMDGNVMERLFAIYKSINRWHRLTDPPPPAPLPGGQPKALTTASLLKAALESGLRQGLDRPEDQDPVDVYDANFATSLTEEARDNQRSGEGPSDIWSDHAVLQFLRTQELPPTTGDTEARRIKKRAQGYAFRGEQLIRIIPNRGEKWVVRPDAREKLILDMHDQCGHWGVKRTLHLVMLRHWWKGMLGDVVAVVGACAACARVKATFDVTSPTLHPLEIRGMFYRWHCDLFGPVKDDKGSQFAMICIEAFTKWAVVVPIQSKHARNTAHVFLTHVLTVFGASAEVVTDGGTEFAGEFQELCERAFIDHRTTSAYHPQGNGQAERAVQSIKNALRKLCESRGTQSRWTEHLPWLMLGYRCSKHASTGFSPYELLFGVAPIIPPAVKERFAEPIDLSDPETASTVILARGVAAARATPIAWDNQLIAQHRDTLRYATKRGGAWTPKLKKFIVGDYVYLKGAKPANALIPTARPQILRVSEVRPGGVLLLHGKCGSEVSYNVANCAPCHLPIAGDVDHTLARPDKWFGCSVCNFPDEKNLILCDSCRDGYHTQCLDPPLLAVPKGVWQCPTCLDEKVPRPKTKAVADEPTQEPVDDEGPWTHLSPAVRAERAAKLDGRIVNWRQRHGGEELSCKGRVQFMGAHASGTKWFTLLLEDGREVKNVPLDKVRKALMAKGVSFVSPPTATTLVTFRVCPSPFPTDKLPRSLHFSTPAAALSALQLTMPGHWPSAYATRLHSVRDQGPSHSRSLLPPGALQALRSVIHLSTLQGSLDPFDAEDPRFDPGRLGAEFVRDPTQPHMYDFIRAYDGSWLDAMLSCPPPELLDIVLPVMLQASTTMMGALVPAAYLRTLPTPRANWLDQLIREDRLLIIRGTGGHHSVVHTWLIVFSGAATKRLIVRSTVPGLIHNHEVRLS
jgi:hypothetical protein